MINLNKKVKLYGTQSFQVRFDGLVQDCSISSALAMDKLQSCTKPSIWLTFIDLFIFYLIPHERNEIVRGSHNVQLRTPILLLYQPVSNTNGSYPVWII